MNQMLSGQIVEIAHARRRFGYRVASAAVMPGLLRHEPRRQAARAALIACRTPMRSQMTGDRRHRTIHGIGRPRLPPVCRRENVQ